MIRLAEHAQRLRINLPESTETEIRRILKTMKIDGKRVWNNSWTGEDIKPDLTYFKKGNKKFVPGIHFVRLVK